MLPTPEKHRQEVRSRLPFVTAKYRILGMGLGGLPIAVVLTENQAPWPYWVAWFFMCYLWPWVALFRATKSLNPFLAERSNLLLDSFIAGLWVALLHFNLLPAVMLLAITTADKISTGINRLWQHSIPFTIVGILVGGVFTGFAFHPHTSMPVIIASLPIMVVHTLVVSLGTFFLVRKVNHQNQTLTVANQADHLTGLFNRGHWQKQAIEQFEKTKPSVGLSLMLVDVDNFKTINDSFGHSVGDDVLQAIAQVLTRNAPKDSIIGRLGGDEFAIILPVDKEIALEAARRIHRESAAIHIKNHPKVRCSISFGLASHKEDMRSMRQWFDITDKRLYIHKGEKNHRGTIKRDKAVPFP